MTNNFLRSEIIVSILFIGLTILFLNPCQKIWMPTMFMSMILLSFVVVFLVFAAIIWKETTGDERELFHRHIAGRASFLVGTGILVAGIITQTLQHTLDPWLLVALCGMVITKLVVRFYKDRTN